MRTLIAVVALSSLLASTSHASVVLHETIEEMAQRVPLIVRATAVRSVAGYDDSRKRIWTWTELQVTDVIKGHASATLLVKQPGGDVEGVGQTVSGTAQFQTGEDCIVFLEPAPDEKTVYRVSSLAAGKVQLTTWQGQHAAVRDMRGLALAGKKGPVTVVQGPEFLGSPDAFVAKLKVIGRGGR